MIEVNNGVDGNDDATNGEHNKEGGNAMDMDPKGKDEKNTSNNGGQDGAFMSHGVQGMQLAQSENNIGAIKVPLILSGDPLSANNLIHNLLFSNILAPLHFRLNDNSGSDSHTDCVPGISAWGLPQVLSGSATLPGSESESSLAGVQHGLSASARVLPADGQWAGKPKTATCAQVVLTAAKEGSAVAADAVVDGAGRGPLAQKICMQNLPASGLALLQATLLSRQQAEDSRRWCKLN
jgi:hypothetical protein